MHRISLLKQLVVILAFLLLSCGNTLKEKDTLNTIHSTYTSTFVKDSFDIYVTLQTNCRGTSRSTVCCKSSNFTSGRLSIYIDYFDKVFSGVMKNFKEHPSKYYVMTLVAHKAK